MSRSAVEYLRHMRDEAQFILDATADLSKNQFEKDEILRRAVVRALEVIGEAAKHVPAAFRSQHSEIPWRSIVRMRDHLIHGYITIDYDLVWNVVTEKVAALNESLRQIIDGADSQRNSPNDA
jgi:uncharacterized protein with HEPN domain